MLIAAFFEGCSNSDDKVIDYKDSKGRIIAHSVTHYFTKGQYCTTIDYKGSNGRIIKQCILDSMIKEEFELYNEWFVSKSIHYFDTSGRSTLWLFIIKRFNKSVDSTIYETMIEKEKHVYQYPTPNRMVEITYTFHTNNFDDTNWIVWPNTLKGLAIFEADKNGDKIGLPIYTKVWPAGSTNSIDSTQARESYRDSSTGRYSTNLVNDTSFDISRLSKYYK